VIVRSPVAALALALATLSCSERPRPPAEEEQAAKLEGDAVARVGGDAIPASLVADVARAQSISPEAALRALVDDATAAQGARERGLDKTLPFSWRLRAARARFAADAIRAEARAQGGPTDEELAAATLRHWQFVDRGETVRVVHALAAKSRSAATPPSDAAVRETAAALRAATAHATSGADFIARAKTVTAPPGVEIVAQALPPFTDDGWAAEGNGRMAESFTRGAWALKKPGDTSELIESPFGWHIIRIEERIAPRRMSLEERRVALADEIYAERAKAMAAKRRASLAAATKVEINAAAGTLTARLFRPSDAP
jgi:peptidyl-prolyl cis-trans isomerase C